MGNSIFEFDDKFGVTSDFGDWLQTKEAIAITDARVGVSSIRQGMYNANSEKTGQYENRVALTITVSTTGPVQTVTADYDGLTYSGKPVVDPMTQSVSNTFIVEIDVVVPIPFQKIGIQLGIVATAQNGKIVSRTIETEVNRSGTATSKQVSEKQRCLCKGNLSAKDLDYIVTQLRQLDTNPISKIPLDVRKNRTYIDNDGKVIPSTDRGTRPPEAVRVNLVVVNQPVYDEKAEDKKAFADRLFMFKAKGLNIKNEEANYTTFVNQLDRIFSKYKIDTCLRRIHFLAQAYSETNKFRSTYENVQNTGYFGGDFYQGRGLKQITHDYNYLNYFCYQTQDAEKKNLFKLYMDNRAGFEESVTAFNARTSNQYISLEEMQDVDELASKISTGMYYACDAAGWYWHINGINEYADNDDIIGVSAKVNAPSAKKQKTSEGINGFDNRKKYYELLKIIFDYENCK